MGRGPGKRSCSACSLEGGAQLPLLVKQCSGGGARPIGLPAPLVQARPRPCDKAFEVPCSILWPPDSFTTGSSPLMSPHLSGAPVGAPGGSHTLLSKLLSPPPRRGIAEPLPTCTALSTPPHPPMDDSLSLGHLIVLSAAPPLPSLHCYAGRQPEAIRALKDTLTAVSTGI